MSIFDGVVTFDEDQVPVILGVEESGIRMSIGGSEIGEWHDGEYSIDDEGEGVYAITAESETLRFVPNNPRLFAADVLGTVVPSPDEAAEREAPRKGPRADAELQDGPEPKATTKAVFYLIAGFTAILGLWALFTLLTG